MSTLLESTFASLRGFLRPSTLPAFMAVATLLSLTGCSSTPQDRGSVSGVVYADGVELKSGTVRFVPIDGTEGPIATASLVDGFFSLPKERGPVVGKHRVEVVATNFLGFDPGDEAAAAEFLKKNAGNVPKNPVPPGYGARSPLTAEVTTDGAEGLVFLLETKGVVSGVASR